ncbi:hypothetical protein C0Q88_07285 [Ralstonia pickettii]|uniref:Uncharacterized protein n=1 Tax=Ralstonia pickettii TaxID=329 RepID=A0A2N4TXN2_RALPI|nr:hypothetical protein [Ralstonia pickettii]PLC44474.1 hypothetical protein C0Q88_07285 [Ralstonia pickettii]
MCSGATNSNNAATQSFAKQIDLSRYADLVAEGEVMEELDIGSAILCRVSHPVVGVVTLLNTSAGHAALLC